jgi:ankyrin repeat protein
MRVSHRLIVAVAAASTSAVVVAGCDRAKGPSSAGGGPASGKSTTPVMASGGNGAAEFVDTDPSKLLFRALVLYRDAAKVIEIVTAHPELASKPISGMPPLALACDSESLPVVQALVDRKADVNARDVENHTVLWTAVRRGTLPIIKYLIEHGADVKELQDDGQTLLWAAESREMAEFLIAAGIDPKHKDINRDTALHVACRHSQTEVVELLLDRGLDIEAVGHWDMRPLETAAATETGDPKPVVMLLLRRGANINARGFKGHTALHECAFYNRPAMADLLLSRGADPNVKDDDGRTPADLAIFAGKNERWRMINQFYKRGGLGPDGKPPVLLQAPKDQ